jgi:hypothetical protein
MGNCRNDIKIKSMKTIKSLTVSVTYKVQLGNIEVSDEILEQLDSIYGDGWTCDGDAPNAKGAEWLSDNINESDAFDWEYEINHLDTEEE